MSLEMKKPLYLF